MSGAQLGNFIGYNGKVKASICVGGNKKEYILLNSGTKTLWDLLAKAMLGYPIADEIPAYFDIVNGNGTSLLRNRILFRAKVWGDEVGNGVDTVTSTSAKFTATVTESDKLTNKVGSGQQVALRMYGANGKSHLAQINDENNALFNLYNNITVGTDAIFEWILTFSNQKEG